MKRIVREIGALGWLFGWMVFFLRYTKDSIGKLPQEFLIFTIGMVIIVSTLWLLVEFSGGGNGQEL